ncbi:hypothetical protein CDIK_3715 [Cucumispora dikerogammari]|nr:hypothetical protein CDIK_3715 [Cucumispora dikerogammari]
MYVPLCMLISCMVQSSELGADQSKQRKETVKLYKDLEKAVLKIHKKCLDMKNKFDKEFQRLIKDYITSNKKKIYCGKYEYRGLDTYGPDKDVNNIVKSSKTYSFSLTKSSSDNRFKRKRYISQDVYNHSILGASTAQVRLRKLFFSDLFCFCHRFFSKINFMIMTDAVIVKSLNYDYIKKLFVGLIKYPELCKEKKMDFSYLNSFFHFDYNLLYFINRLEDFVIKKININKETLRKMLYNMKEFSLDINDKNKILAFWDTFSNLVKFYVDKDSTEQENDLVSGIIVKIERSELKKTNLLNILVKNFKCFLDIDVFNEWRSLKRPLRDPRMKEYEKMFGIFNSCPECRKSTLMYIKCETHAADILKVKKSFHELITYDFSRKNSNFLCNVVIWLGCTQRFVTDQNLVTENIPQ